jgi:TPR repeat protein
VEFDRISLPEAESACQNAVETYPNESRLQFQYGRTLHKAGKYGQALQWYHKVAELGNSIAMTNIGLFYEKGYGVSKDYKEAFKWYQKAADLGNATAMNNKTKCRRSRPLDGSRPTSR